MKCKWRECENEARSKSPFCGGTCKKRHQRASGTDVPVEVGQELSGTQVGQTLGSASSTQNTDEQETGESTIIEQAVIEYVRTAGLQDYYDNPDNYYPRREPERLNWGAWLNMDQLKQADLRANRVPIPGDWDYEGVMTEERIDTDHDKSLGMAEEVKA